MDIKKQFAKIQALPEEKRKIIFWIAITVASLIIFPLWMTYAKSIFGRLSPEEALKSVVPDTSSAPSSKQAEDARQQLKETENYLNNLNGLQK